MAKPLNPAISFLLILIVLAGFFFFFALPWAHRQQCESNEKAARTEIQKFVKQQEEYRKKNPKGDGVLEYAITLEELHKGEVVNLLDGSITDCEWGKGRAEYLGYWFKIVVEQGPGASGGAKTYIKDSRLTQGYGLIVWPKAYGTSGHLSYQVSHEGKLYQKDLGEETQEVAEKWKAFDPQGWTAVP